MDKAIKKIITIQVIGLIFILFGGLTQPGLAQTQTGAFFTPNQPKKDADPFKILHALTPDTLSPGGRGEIAVTFKIAPNHKIYADRTSVTPEEVPGIEFNALIRPAGIEQKEPDGSTARFYKKLAVFRLPVTIDQQVKPGKLSIPLTVRYQGCSGNNCFFPQEKTIVVQASVTPPPETGLLQTETRPAPASPETSAENDQPATTTLQKAFNRFGLAGVLVAAFLWGFLASLTPCVYPMIPVTMGVIGSTQAGSLMKGFTLSLFYVLGMSLTYAGFGVAAAWSGGLFGAVSDHPAVRILIAVILILLGFSMFDLFYIQMPAWITNRLGGAKGAGFAGVFAAGAAAGALVGPCVGPMLVGILIYIAAIGSKIQGFLIMWSFALGMGILFLVIGTFSGAAASLPKSGEWMVKLKYFFGVLMLALALYYIKPLLPPALFILCLSAFLIGVGVFAGAFDALGVQSTGFDRLSKAAGILLLSLGIAYSARFVFEETAFFSAAQTSSDKPAIAWQTDEPAALALARKQNKPVMIDFYADWCSACKRLETHTFSDPDVIQIAQSFVAVKIDNSDTADPSAEKLRKKYKVVGLPTVLFLSHTGDIIKDSQITEYVDASRMAEVMKQVTGERRL